MVQLKLDPVDNENLFTKHYLEERVVNLPEWGEEEEIKEVFEEIKKIYERKKSILSSCNESQLREEFLNPVLRVLGFHLGVEASVQHGAKQPDYALFKDEEDKMEAYQKQESEDFYQKSVAVADAKAWNVEFDKKTGERNVFENRNPSFQIYYYLDSTPPDWGFLTNGRKWRLYYDEISLSQWFETYYEVDLIDILEKDDLESFKYFYLFFRKKAFTPVGDCFLDQAYQGSERYAQEIGESLEDNVYNALRWMAKGYFDMGTNNLEKTEENIKEVHDNSLIFLYRLIFLLYAESNGLLESGGEIPQKYSQYSVYEWAEELLEEWDNNELSETGGLHYYKLSEIFKLVRDGSEKQGIPREEFHVPAYNGGLFDNQKHPFFNKYKIQDGNLAKVVDLLLRTYSEEAGEKVWVDYSDLSLRHLGGIYEGLLEHQLKIAEEKLVAEGDSKTGEWIPASEASKDFSEFDKENRKREGELYLQTDKGERKATGSYYTPDYIVKYIVENTVGPVIEEKLEDAETDEEKRQAILSTNVLDPAMGSGHFLVEAVDFLASRLVEFVENGGEERDIDWAKRKVARNCIYGVDINPLATELAKVSLWLNTMAEDKPLSFLDHHLKTGNSLIGADLHKLDKHPEGLDEKEEDYEQLPLYGKSFQENIKELLNVLKDISEITEESPEDIKEQEELLRKFENHSFKKKFDVLADVQTSYYFGNEFSKKDYTKLLDVFRVENLDDIVWEKLSQTERVRKASDSVPDKREDNLSDEKKFFHWKLEFPEVFFDIGEGTEKDNPGFNAVIGNPPYGADFSSKEQEYLKNKYRTSGLEYDSYTFFIENGISLLKQEGNMGYIVPTVWTKLENNKPLRDFLLNEVNIYNLVDCGKVFDTAIVETLILGVSKTQTEKSSTSIKILNRDGSVRDRLNRIKARSWKKEFEIQQSLFLENNSMKINYDTVDPQVKRIIGKIESESNLLRNIADISQGTTPYDSYAGQSQEIINNRAYHSNEKEDETYGKWLKGRDVGRYSLNWSGEWLSYGNWLAAPREKHYFTQPRILFREVTGGLDRVIATYTEEEYYYGHSVIPAVVKDSCYSPFTLLSIVNSRLLTWYNLKVSPNAQKDAFPKMNPDDVRKLPIKSEVKEKKKRKLSNAAKNILSLKKELQSLNLNLPDYLGNYSKGQTIDELYIPISGISNTVLTDTKTDRDNLKLGRVEFEEDNGKLILKASAKYKPENEDEFDDLDRWGYTETDLIPAMKFSGSKEMLSLIKEFTKLAVDEAGGFANFREKATKTKSLIDRLEELTLPKLDDVESGLKKYLEQREKAEKLEKEIQETDNLIDAIVFDLYDLTEDEVKTVLDSLDTEREVREDILEKFGELEK